MGCAASTPQTADVDPVSGKNEEVGEKKPMEKEKASFVVSHYRVLLYYYIYVDIYRVARSSIYAPM